MDIIKNVSTSKVADLLNHNNIVAIFQGRSEAGPRALGNRSILFNPTMKNGRDVVNMVKKREWWRPFAGIILHDHFHEWFDTKILEESAFMSYAINFKTKEKSEIVPCISHGGTCRIQTLKKENNPNVYQLISDFHGIRNNPPIIGNTSFNLAGDPLVETLEESIDTLERSDLEYLYLPESKELIYIKNK